MSAAPQAPTADEVFRELRSEGDAARAHSDRPLSSTTLLIAIVPRTGSTALCSLLEGTGLLGAPREYLNPRGPLRPWARRLGAVDLPAYVDLLRRERATPNGLFALKTLYPDLEPLLALGPLAESLGETAFVYLTRDDLIAQAISAYIADASGVWHRDRSGERFRSRGGGDADPPYDEARIRAERDAIVGMQEAWERFFTERSIEPLRITYERFIADADGTVAAIARHVGVDWTGEVGLEEAVTARLADARNERWAERLRASDLRA